MPRVGPLTLPTERLPGSDDTVILDRSAASVTVTLASGAHNIRKLEVREALDITGGSLTINYVPSADSTPLAAQFSAPVTLDGYRPSEHWHGNPPTEKQLALLRKFSVHVDVRTAGEASHLIDREIDRRNSLPVTPKQIAFLRHHGIDATAMSRRDAAVAIGRIKSRAGVVA